MLPLYFKKKDMVEIKHEICGHFPPHLHSSIECVYVTSGSLELGVGEELYHMEKGDFGIVFPDLIHHNQVFDTRKCTAYYLIASPSLCGPYQEMMQEYCPKQPVIPKNQLHPDVVAAFKSLFKYPAKEQEEVIHQAWIHIILARTLPLYEMVDKNSVGSHDIVYETVSYISKNFREPISLSQMAKDLGYSPYALSRVFSGTFHRNFNQYVNERRLDYACNLLKYTDQSITDVSENSGFESLRTFNRVFKERYHVTPREYRQRANYSAVVPPVGDEE